MWLKITKIKSQQLTHGKHQFWLTVATVDETTVRDRSNVNERKLLNMSTLNHVVLFIMHYSLLLNFLQF